MSVFNRIAVYRKIKFNGSLDFFASFFVSRQKWKWGWGQRPANKANDLNLLEL